MSIAATLAERFTKTGALDPDTLHGLLLLEEVGNHIAAMAKLIHERPGRLAARLDKARLGTEGRVPPCNGDDPHRPLEYEDGFLTALWQRELVAAMLRADGICAEDVRDLLLTFNAGVLIGKATNILRAVLGKVGVRFDLKMVEGKVCYRISGSYAARVQTIIANGWQA